MAVFSVVMPTFNVAPFLPRALECMLGQTYGDFELYLVDDGSTDGSGEIAEEYAERFRRLGRRMEVVRQPENMGVSDARNTGMRLAAGEYILFLDPDDFYEERLLEKVAGALKRSRPDIVLYGHTEDYYDGEGSLTYTRAFCNAGGEQLLQKEQIPGAVVEWEKHTMYGYPWNKAYRLDFLRRHDVSFPRVTHVEDILFNIRAFEDADTVAVLGEALYHYRNQGQARLTGKYLADYFALQKMRIQAFLEQQRRWGNCGGEALEAMAACYFRSFQSAIMRELEHGARRKEVRAMAAKELEEPLYRELRGHLGGGRVARILYAPLARGNVASGVRRAWLLWRVKSLAPGLFVRLKQHR